MIEITSYLRYVKRSLQCFFVFDVVFRYVLATLEGAFLDVVHKSLVHFM